MDLPSIVHTGGPSLLKPEQHYALTSAIYENTQPTAYPSTSGFGQPGDAHHHAEFGVASHDHNETSYENNKSKKTRKRQQTSCVSCHQRKQKCNKEVPCDRCIKRGSADTCRIMAAGEKHTTPETAAGANPEPKKRRYEQSENSDLADRVKQLEDIIRMSQLAGEGASSQKPATQGQPTLPHRQDSDESSKRRNSSETNAIEEAAVAALSTLSKAMPTEEGVGTRIYSGPSSMTAFLDASGFGANSDQLAPYKEARFRPSDLVLYDTRQQMANPSLRLSKLADALAEHKQKLPPAAICHHLFNEYHSCPLFKDRNRNFPRGCYQHSYDGLFGSADLDMSKGAEEARKQGYPQLTSPNSLAFVSMVFGIFAISLSLSPDATPDTHALASVMYENSRSAFLASERREQPSYACILALLSNTVWLKLAGCPSVGMTYMSQSIRFAQNLGMHREPAESWGLGKFEIEIRRRIWWSLIFIDKFHSLAYGMPYTTNAKHCDVDLPSNIYCKDLTADGPTNIRPESEVTEMTISIIQARFSYIVTEIVDRALSCTVPTYSTILELDNLLTNFETGHVITAFKDPSGKDLAEKPYLAGDLAGYQLNFMWVRSLLHRPYLLRPLPAPGEPDHYAGSRAMTIMLSKKILGINKDAIAGTPLNLQAYFSFAFNAFEPAVNMSMAILQDPLHPQASTLDTHVQQAMGLLEGMSSVNRVAGEGLASIVAMRTRYLQAIADTKPQTSISPPFSTDSGSNPSPSLYTSTGPSPVSTSTSVSAGDQTLALPRIPADNAATPNTLFNQFFGQHGSTSTTSATDINQKPVQEDSVDIDQLFNFDFSMYNADPTASWLTEPIVGGLDAWPGSFDRLEGESLFDDWKSKLGF